MDAYLNLHRLRLFCSHVHFTDLETCWEWLGAQNVGGYGQLFVGKDLDGRRIIRRAHQVAYWAWIGPVPEGLSIDHLCRNRLCVNPGHLEAVPQAVNLRRGRGNGYKEKTHCKWGHPLDGDNLYTLDTGSYIMRQCRTCKRRAGLESWRRKRNRQLEVT